MGGREVVGFGQLKVIQLPVHLLNGQHFHVGDAGDVRDEWTGCR